MAMTRQYGNSGSRPTGTIIFTPSVLQINCTALPDSGEFLLYLSMNVKDSNGLIVANEKVSFELLNVPVWLSTANIIYEMTNDYGSAVVTIKGRILKSHPEKQNTNVMFTVYTEQSRITATGILIIND